jgi:hypothetical protein
LAKVGVRHLSCQKKLSKNSTNWCTLPFYMCTHPSKVCGFMCKIVSNPNILDLLKPLLIFDKTSSTSFWTTSALSFTQRFVTYHVSPYTHECSKQ